MVESIKRYIGEHHWGIIQGVSGVYCAVLATWERFNPVLGSTQNRTTSGPVGGAMTQNYYMPWWLWGGIVCLCLSVAVPAIIKMTRKRKPLTMQEAAAKWANDHNYNHCVKLGIAALEMFTPLQWEAFQLSHSLGAWLEQFEPEPLPGQQDTFERIFDHAVKVRGAWTEKLDASFRLHWDAKVRTLTDKFGELGVNDPMLTVLLDRRNGGKATIIQRQERIVCLAFQVKGLHLKPVENPV